MFLFQEVVKITLGLVIGLLMGRKELYQLIDEVEYNKNQYK